MPVLRVTFALLALAARAAADSSSFTVYSEPIELRYGEVHNRMQGELPLPPDVVARYAQDGAPAMAITSFEMDMVRIDKDTGNETRVPLYESYLHHYILDMGSSADVGALVRAARGPRDSKAAQLLRRMNHAAARRELGLGGASVSFGGASGAEFRDNPHVYRDPTPHALRSQ